MCPSSGGQNCITQPLVSSHLSVAETVTYRFDDTRGCVMQFWPPDDEHMCSKHVEAWNKLIVKQKFCASSWLIAEINILRCTVSKTSKQKFLVERRLYGDLIITSHCRFKPEYLMRLWSDDGCFTAETCSPDVTYISSMRFCAYVVF